MIRVYINLPRRGRTHHDMPEKEADQFIADHMREYQKHNGYLENPTYRRVELMPRRK